MTQVVVIADIDGSQLIAGQSGVGGRGIQCITVQGIPDIVRAGFGHMNGCSGGGCTIIGGV